METQLIFGDSSAKIKIRNYKFYGSSVGNNLKSIQITTKYRYQMLKQERLKIYCKVSIEEACKSHKIEIIILKVLNEHCHLIVDCPRTINDSKLIQIIKGLSSYILFRLCSNFRKRYTREEFWNDEYFLTLNKSQWINSAKVDYILREQNEDLSKRLFQNARDDLIQPLWKRKSLSDLGLSSGNAKEVLNTIEGLL